MKVSINTIRELTGVTASVDEIIRRVNSQLGTVEDTVNLSEKYKDAIVVQVVKVEKHPNADRLNVCLINDNGARADVSRDESGYVQVVCGAPNVREDMFAVWLPPQSIVPSTYNDTDPFVLGSRELRGVVSQGMLAAGDELALNSDHDGIVALTKYDLKDQTSELAPGMSFSKTFGFDDIIIDIENKMFTHRPDLFGQLGVAREVFAIMQPESNTEKHTNVRFNEPDWYWSMPEFITSEGLVLNVENNETDSVPRLMAVAMQNIKIKPSPVWLQACLVRWGSKAINNVVDITNYIMLLTAQPTHAYDYDSLRGQTIGARLARVGESVKLLNGKTYHLHTDDIVIVDGDGPIGLAGIMGGSDSEVTLDTTNIVLEVATFNMYTLRKTSMRHGLFTDALTRFNKGQSPYQNNHVMAQLMKLMQVYAGAEQASDVYDRHSFDETTDTSTLSGTLEVSTKFINERLGLTLTPPNVGNLLRLANFAAFPPDGSDDALLITAPYWRTDIELPEDIVEEVGRLYGFDRLPRVLPARSIDPPEVNHARAQSRDIRAILSKAGANEVLTYSFVHENVMKRAGQDKTHAYQLSNALSPDLQYYRLSITPSLLDKVHMNYKAGYEQFALFETNKVHYKGEMDSLEPSVPNEDTHTALVVARGEKLKLEGSAYYLAKRYAEKIVRLNDYEVVPLTEFDLDSDEWARQLTAPYSPSRSAVLIRNNQVWGVIGEFTHDVKRAFKLPEYSAGFEFHSGIISVKQSTYTPLSRYPSTARDVSFKVDQAVSYASILSALTLPDSVSVKLSPVGIYQPNGATTKNVTIRFTLAAHDSTLSAEQANQIIDQSIKSVVVQTGAEIV